MNSEQSPLFPQPDPESKVWRYLGLDKFLWLLEHKRLYMPRIESLRDPFEGSIPRAISDSEEEALLKNASRRVIGPLMGAVRDYFEHELKDRPKQRRILRATTYVSCWTVRESESEALWQLYCGNQDGVAIQTTYSNLYGILSSPEFEFIGKVTYLDHERQDFALDHQDHSILTAAHEFVVSYIVVDNLSMDEDQ